MIDWQAVCLNLRRSYRPLSQVAKEVGSDWQTLNRLARDEIREPRFSVGVRLLDLHATHCAERHSKALLRE